MIDWLILVIIFVDVFKEIICHCLLRRWWGSATTSCVAWDVAGVQPTLPVDMKSKSRLLWETSLAMPNNSTLHYLNPSNIEIFFKREEIRNHYHFFVELRNGSPTSVYLTLTASPCTWFGVRVAGDARTVFARTTSTFPWVGFHDMDSSETNWLQNYLS